MNGSSSAVNKTARLASVFADDEGGQAATPEEPPDPGVRWGSPSDGVIHVDTLGLTPSTLTALSARTIPIL
jgi:hypothetical protein